MWCTCYSRPTNHRCQTPVPRRAEKILYLSGGSRRTARRRPLSCGGFVFLFCSSSDDPDRIVRQRPLQRFGLIPGGARPNIATAVTAGWRSNAADARHEQACRWMRSAGRSTRRLPSFRCRSCGTRRYKPPVCMIKLTEQREIMPRCILEPVKLDPFFTASSRRHTAST